MPNPLRTTFFVGGPGPLGCAVALGLHTQNTPVVCGYRDEAEHAAWDDVVRTANVSLQLEPLTQLASLAPDCLVHLPELPTDDSLHWGLALGGLLEATLSLWRTAAGPMKARGHGRIVGLSSPAAVLGSPQAPALAPAAAAMMGLVRTLARELAPHGITVNAVSPGVLVSQAQVPGATELLQRTPLGRAVPEAQVAAAVRMLLDARAGYVTGQCLAVDGGLT